jgi:2-polyprenyl-3-methyl-5-hydroxy-6-metoxy-1,4-benzoquinol methylase
MSSAEFYDNFIDQQVKSGINDRIYGLYRRFCKTGINRGSAILEIGCGIGALTYLLTRKVTRGAIQALDISAKSVEFARQQLKAPNLTITTADVLQFEPQVKQFDRILLFDVLEHIPLNQHPQVFNRISQWMHAEGLLLINIPNPAYILYDQHHNPATLQETDQPVYLAPLSAALDSALLDIISLETYSVWVKEDYQFMVVRKRRPFEEKLLSSERNLFQKGAVWMKRRWRMMRNPYPRKY